MMKIDENASESFRDMLLVESWEPQRLVRSWMMPGHALRTCDVPEFEGVKLAGHGACSGQ